MQSIYNIDLIPFEYSGKNLTRINGAYTVHSTIIGFFEELRCFFFNETAILLIRRESLCSKLQN